MLCTCPLQNASERFPPVIVEVQHTVDLQFMFRVMSYFQQLFLQYNIVPIVLIFAISQIRHITMLNCRVSRKHAFLLKYRKETWTQTCYLIDHSSISTSLQKLPLHPLVSLSLFLTGRHKPLVVNLFRTDATVQMLYGIARQIYED